MKQVRERLAKGLVDKGVLRTEKQNFILFDMATHPVADLFAKEAAVRKVVQALLAGGSLLDRRTIALVTSAYASNVLEKALVQLSATERETAFERVDELLKKYSNYDESVASNCTEVMAAVLSVFSKMDTLLAG